LISPYLAISPHISWQAIKEAARLVMSSSPGRPSSPQTRRRESLKVRSVSPSQQQITRSAGITDVARKELPAAELAALGPRYLPYIPLYPPIP